ncbi:159_t:CDS:2, partial [Gigaspora rosea]
SLSKRRIYDNNDENLGRPWNALKDGKVEKHDGGQFLELSRDTYYLLGKYEHSSNTSTLNPGIGITLFGNYLLYLLSQQCKTVVYHKHNKFPIFFSEEGVLSHTEDNVLAFRDYSAMKKFGISWMLGTNIQYMPVWSWKEIKHAGLRFSMTISKSHPIIKSRTGSFTPQKSRPPWINRLKQYALEIDLKMYVVLLCNI